MIVKVTTVQKKDNKQMMKKPEQQTLQMKIQEKATIAKGRISNT